MALELAGLIVGIKSKTSCDRKCPTMNMPAPDNKIPMPRLIFMFVKILEI